MTVFLRNNITAGGLKIIENNNNNIKTAFFTSEASLHVCWVNFMAVCNRFEETLFKEILAKQEIFLLWKKCFYSYNSDSRRQIWFLYITNLYMWIYYIKKT